MTGRSPTVAIVGSGAWGTTLALLIAKSEPVTLLCHSAETADRLSRDRRNERRLPGVVLPEGIRPTVDPAALNGASLVVFAVPSTHLRATASRLAPSIPQLADILSVVKGLEAGTLLRMTEVIDGAASIDRRRIAALSGPNLALEIAAGLPASAVVAAADPELADRVVARLARREFRLYTNTDVLGVELCGALKNVIAIAAGAADGLGFGDNGKAGLMTRGLAEMTRLGIAAGANPLTFAGLAGIGDVIATCGSHLSRNHRLGEELAKGRRWADIEASLPGVAEGAYTVDAALALAERLGVEMPIAREVHNALFEGKSVQRCLVDLLARESKDELADFRGWLDRLAPAAARRAPDRRGRRGRPACSTGHGRRWPGPRRPESAGRWTALVDSRPCRGVAQPGSAPEWGSGGRAFESLRPDQQSGRKTAPRSDPTGRSLVPWHEVVRWARPRRAGSVLLAGASRGARSPRCWCCRPWRRTARRLRRRFGGPDGR